MFKDAKIRAGKHTGVIHLRHDTRYHDTSLEVKFSLYGKCALSSTNQLRFGAEKDWRCRWAVGDEDYLPRVFNDLFHI